MNMKTSYERIKPFVNQFEHVITDGFNRVVKNAKKPKNQIEQDYKNLNQLHFIGNHLNYRDYKDGIFINEDSFGFCMYASPLTGASEQLANRLMGLFSLRWPQGATLSFMLYSSKEIKDRLDSWVEKRRNAHPLIYEMAKARANYLARGINSSLVKDEKIIVRDYRLVISVTFNGKLRKENQAERVVDKERRTYCDYFNFIGGTPSSAPSKSDVFSRMDELFKK